MAEHGGADGAARPITAGHVITSREGSAVRLRAGEDVVHVRLVAARVDGLALLAEAVFLADFVVVAVQIVDIFCNHDAFGVLPWAFADPITGINPRLAVGRAGAQVGAPGVVAGAGRLRQRLAMFISACQTAQVRALAGTDAGDEKRHFGVFLLRAGNPTER